MFKSRSDLLSFLKTCYRKHQRLGPDKMLMAFADELASHLVAPKEEAKTKKKKGK